VSDAPFRASDEFDPRSIEGRGFVTRLAKRARYSYAYSNEILKALVEFEGAPMIAAGETIKLRLTVSQTNCTSYRRASIKWHAPEGFAVSGRSNVFLKWLPGGEDAEGALNHRADDANDSEITITAGDKVESVNRVIFEIETPGQCQPLLVPVTILA
jgi:hypothetical protein